MLCRHDFHFKGRGGYKPVDLAAELAPTTSQRMKSLRDMRLTPIYP